MLAILLGSLFSLSLSVCLSYSPFLILFSVLLSTFFYSILICPSVNITILSIYRPQKLFFLTTRLSALLCSLFRCLSVCLSVCLPVRLSVCLSVCLSVVMSAILCLCVLIFSVWQQYYTIFFSFVYLSVFNIFWHFPKSFLTYFCPEVVKWPNRFWQLKSNLLLKRKGEKVNFYLS